MSCAESGNSGVLGTINPLGQITAKARERGALVLVDAAQSVAHLPVDVRDLQVDFLAFSESVGGIAPDAGKVAARESDKVGEFTGMEPFSLNR